MNGECAGGLYLSLDDMWASLPAPDVVDQELREWGIFDPTLSSAKL